MIYDCITEQRRFNKNEKQEQLLLDMAKEAEEKNKIIMCGLSALKGEEI